MKANTLKILLCKEISLMKRSPLIPRIIIAMPILVMLIIPLVATFDVKNIDVAVVDNDHSELSRRIAADIDASEYLSITGCYFRYDEALAAVENGTADVILTIPQNYLKDLANGKMPKLDLKANGVNVTKGTLGAQYAAASATGTLRQWQNEQGSATLPATASIINRYNPTLDFRNYMIPALMVILIIIICGFLPTLNLVNEKEAGTIEAMNVTPVGKFVFVLSKLIPYWIVGLLVVTVGMIIGWAVYGLVPEGNIFLIYLATLLFSLVMSGLGVFVANKSTTILQSIFMIFAFIIIFQLMSGLFTPIASMPQWAQYITYAIPPRYFIEIMRAVYLKGASMADLWQQYAALLGFATLLSIIAAITYKKRA